MLNKPTMKLTFPTMPALAALVAVQAAAATFTVNETRDLDDRRPGDGACEATAGVGDCSLRAAVREANAVPGADVIEVPAGSWTLAIPGENEDAGATGDLDVDDSLTIRGAGRAATILDAAGLDRVLDVMGSDSAMTVVVQGVTVRGGTHGGVRALGPASLVMRDCELTGNSSPASGGAMYAALAVVTLDGTVIRGNSAESRAGAIRIHGGALILQRCEIEGNVVRGPEGGAGIYASRCAVSIMDSRILDRVAPLEAERQDGMAERSGVLNGVLALGSTVDVVAAAVAANDGDCPPTALVPAPEGVPYGARGR